MDAVKRGCEMMAIPRNQLPPLALEFSKVLCMKYGGCGEVMITAYSVYNQIVENMTCDDDLYLPDIEAIEWFKDKGYEYKK